LELTGELLRIEYINLDVAVLWDRNPKRHDLPRLIASVQKHGFRDAPIYDSNINGEGRGGIAAGNGRATALKALRNQGEPPPRGVGVDGEGAWYLPVQFGNDSASQAMAQAFAIDHNNLTLAGSGLDMSALWDAAGYADVLRGLADGFALPVTVDAEEAKALFYFDPDGINFKEYDESVENEVEYIECPNCGQQIPK